MDEKILETWASQLYDLYIGSPWLQAVGVGAKEVVVYCTKSPPRGLKIPEGIDQEKVRFEVIGKVQIKRSKDGGI